MLRCLLKKLDCLIAGRNDVDGIVIFVKIRFTFASRDSFMNVNKKSFKHTGVSDRYLDFSLVWKLDLHQMFLGVHNVLYRVNDRYIRNRRALCATSFLALLVLQPIWNGLRETHPDQFLL